MRYLAPLAIVISAALVVPALADVKGRDGKIIECYCTDRTGSRVELGQSICLQVDGRMFTAQCQMSLNVPMWREVQKGCLSSEAQSSNPLPYSSPVNTDI